MLPQRGRSLAGLGSEVVGGTTEPPGTVGPQTLARPATRRCLRCVRGPWVAGDLPDFSRFFTVIVGMDAAAIPFAIEADSSEPSPQQ